jgi:hypothetical protein
VDPLSNPILQALNVRPVQPANSNLAVLLRDGFVVAGEVLEMAGGTAFLSLGGKRVAAETDVELSPGERFFARVERGGDSIVLRLLSDAADAELPLVAALRKALADHAPAGTVLTRLVAELRAALQEQPTAFEATSERDPAALARDPATKPAAGETAAGRDRATAQRLLARIEAHVDAPAPDGRALQAALARSGVFHEALLLRGSAGSAVAHGDLKSILLQALGDLSSGAERESVRLALGGIEAEQLLDVARSQSGDARQVSFAVPDGAAFGNARLIVDPDRHEREERSAAGGERASVDLCVDLSTLGPVKAELRLEGGDLRVRFLVASQDVAERIARDGEQLRADLGRDLDASGARAAQLSIALAEPSSIARASHPADVRFLGEHALLDKTA